MVEYGTIVLFNSANDETKKPRTKVGLSTSVRSCWFGTLDEARMSPDKTRDAVSDVVVVGYEAECK